MRGPSFLLLPSRSPPRSSFPRLNSSHPFPLYFPFQPSPSILQLSPRVVPSLPNSLLFLFFSFLSPPLSPPLSSFDLARNLYRVRFSLLESEIRTSNLLLVRRIIFSMSDGAEGDQRNDYPINRLIGLLGTLFEPLVGLDLLHPTIAGNRFVNRHREHIVVLLQFFSTTKYFTLFQGI